jgi:hypothetical protein
LEPQSLIFLPTLLLLWLSSNSLHDKTGRIEIAETSLAHSSIVLTKQETEVLTNQQLPN